VVIICGVHQVPGTKHWEAQLKGSLELLWDTFGGAINSKGYKVLDPHVGLIYGDGMFYGRFEQMLETMKQKGFASSNLVIGVGGLLLQQHSRDELGFAIKATRIKKKDGMVMNIMKDPITDPGKKSKTGLMRLMYDGKWYTEDNLSDKDEKFGELDVVFWNGKMTTISDLSRIRARVEQGRVRSKTPVEVS
jgi:nicotinamide phosphoribosyltransferase